MPIKEFEELQENFPDEKWRIAEYFNDVFNNFKCEPLAKKNAYELLKKIEKENNSVCYSYEIMRWNNK